MPKGLLERCQPDSIFEFRAAARERFQDGLALVATGRRTAAIYIWGYAAEMTLKAAYFSLVGLSDRAVIELRRHINPAIDRARSLGIIWPKQGAAHNVRAWAELVVFQRALSPHTAFPTSFGLAVRRRGQEIEGRWRETLRYHRNFAYDHEVRRVREAVEWFLVNENAL